GLRYLRSLRAHLGWLLGTHTGWPQGRAGGFLQLRLRVFTTTTGQDEQGEGTGGELIQDRGSHDRGFLRSSNRGNTGGAEDDRAGESEGKVWAGPFAGLARFLASLPLFMSSHHRQCQGSGIRGVTRVDLLAGRFSSSRLGQSKVITSPSA